MRKSLSLNFSQYMEFSTISIDLSDLNVIESALLGCLELI